MFTRTKYKTIDILIWDESERNWEKEAIEFDIVYKCPGYVVGKKDGRYNLYSHDGVYMWRFKKLKNAAKTVENFNCILSEPEEEDFTKIRKTFEIVDYMRQAIILD